MVLTFRRIAAVSLITFVHAAEVAAQRGSQPDVPRGQVRPLLFGFALGCFDCPPGEGARGRGRGGAPVVSYRSFPHVLSVAPGSAAEQAGIKEGDILQSIDGLSVLTDPGATRLARAVDGEQVRLVFERNSKPIEFSLVLGSIASRRADSGPTKILMGYMALQGTLSGDLKMEIWTDDPIVFTEPTPTSADGPAGETVLRIGDKTVIRLDSRRTRLTAPEAKPGRGKPGELREPTPR